MTALPSIHDSRFEAKMVAAREADRPDFDDDEFYERLQQWRTSRGEAIMTGWAWWWADEGESEFNGCCDTREAAIAEALVRGAFFGSDGFELIEARCWTDQLADDDWVPFAETRNASTLRTEVDDDGVRHLRARKGRK